METERILITVRTYPNISTKYIETVCTGGINDRGEWRRLYPVSLRYQDPSKQYKTFDVVEVGLRPGGDSRTESRRPEMTTLKITDHLGQWMNRCAWVNPTINASLRKMEADGKSIAPVGVQTVLEFVAKPSAKDWTPEQKALLSDSMLFGDRQPLEKVPFDFRIRWRDDEGDEHDSSVTSWEMYETWRQFRKNYPDPISVMRDKFMGDVFGPAKRLSFFMGNLARFRQTFMIIGWFAPPKHEAMQNALFGV